MDKYDVGWYAAIAGIEARLESGQSVTNRELLDFVEDDVVSNRDLGAQARQDVVNIIDNIRDLLPQD